MGSRAISIMGVLAAVVLGGAIAPAGAKDAHKPNLRLAVHPHSATVGRSTTFRFRVSRTGGDPVAGATVRFAGRSATTGPAGRTKIVASLGHAGKWSARASKDGFRSARRTVTARTAAKRPIGFDGTCDLSGTVSFDPPLKNDPQPITQHADGEGKCTGTFVDRAGRSHDVEDAPLHYVATEFGEEVSCGSGSDAGKGRLIFPGRGSLSFSVSESRAGGLAVLTLRGASGGSGTITGNISPDENQAEILQKCAGEGLEEVGLDAHLTTDGTIRG